MIQPTLKQVYLIGVVIGDACAKALLWEKPCKGKKGCSPPTMPNSPVWHPVNLATNNAEGQNVSSRGEGQWGRASPFHSNLLQESATDHDALAILFWHHSKTASLFFLLTVPFCSTRCEKRCPQSFWQNMLCWYSPNKFMMFADCIRTANVKAEHCAAHFRLRKPCY